MKTILKVRALTVVALLLSCLPAFTADPPKPAKVETKPAAGAAKSSDPWSRRISELVLDGVPLVEVANYLAETNFFPEINFVMADDMKDIPIKLKLRSVNLDDIFTAIALTTKDSVVANKVTDAMVSFQHQEVVGAPVDTKPLCRAFSLSRYLAGKSDKDVDKAMADVEDALNLCWQMLNRADRSNTRGESPQLNLHRGTKLLIVVGQPSQVEVVAQVINQLEEGSGGGGGGGGAVDPTTGLPLPPGYGVPGIPSTPKPPGGK